MGLGNPGFHYRKTRHNLGFRVVDAVAAAAAIAWKKKGRFSAWMGQGTWQGISLVLVKPAAYMNASGGPVRMVMDFFNLTEPDLLVVVDDVNLPPGVVRIRSRGGAGGHHGLESIIRVLGTENFARIRIGVGGTDLEDVTGHVLSRPGKEENACYNRAVAGAVEAVAAILEDGIEKAMNCFNRKE